MRTVRTIRLAWPTARSVIAARADDGAPPTTVDERILESVLTCLLERHEVLRRTIRVR